MKSEDISYYHQIMDTHPTSKKLHGEEPTPLQSNIDIGDDDLAIDTSSKKNEETVTFWIKQGDVSIEQQFSETESEGTHFSQENNNPNKIPIELSFQQSNDDIEYYEEESELVGSSTVCSSEPQRFSSTYDGDTSESNSEIPITKKYEDKKDRVGGAGEVVSSLQEYSQDAPEHLVQSLSSFFTEDEKELMLPPDAVLNVEDKYFVVLPNSGPPGHTLFHCLSQILTGQEQDHKEIREKIMDYICSQAGWDILGDGIVGFYQHLIDEFRVTSEGITEKFGEANGENFQRRVYRHYFMEQEMEGSFIELVAASIIFGLKYTCIFLKEEEGSGNASCRVFHSTCETSTESTVRKMDSLTMNQLRKANKEAQQRQLCQQKNYFLRVGETPENWKWSLVVPYLHNCFRNEEGKIVCGPCTCASLSKGSFEGNLWHVYGLQWNKGTSSLERLVNVQFSWRRAISVIPTSSGKLLGGYVNLGTDLYSNLCPLIPNCLHTGNQCCLRDVVQYCPKNLTCFSFSTALSFADLIMRNKEQHGSKKSRVKLKRHQKGKEEVEPKIGTLKDLHRASKIFNFGYCVVGIDENGLFQTLGRLDKDKTIYLLARINRRRKITEWCALEDMRVYKTCISEQSVGNLLVPGSSSSSSSTTLNEDNNHEQQYQMSDCSGAELINPAVSATSYSSSSRGRRGRRGRGMKRGTPFRLRISRYFTCLRFFIARIKNRNKVRQTKFFPLNEIHTCDDKNNTVRSSVR